jgi:hypothetical protein
MQSVYDVLCCHPWPVWPYHIFPHYLINGTIFGKMLLNIKCVFWFSLQLLSETFLILIRIQRDIIINVRRSSCKAPLFLSDFNETWILLTDFRKIFKYQISWKCVQWEPSCSMRTDRHDEDKLLFAIFWTRLTTYVSTLPVHSFMTHTQRCIAMSDVLTAVFIDNKSLWLWRLISSHLCFQGWQ